MSGWAHSALAIPGGRRPELSSELATEKQALAVFSQMMEEEFLALGLLLGRITALLRDVRRCSDAVMAAACGQTEDAAIQFTFQLLKKAEDLVQSSREQHLQVVEVFRKMQLALGVVAKERDSLLDALFPLSSMTVHFRIQSAAFNDATRRQFFGLADTIDGIVKEVETAIAQNFEDLERTGKSTGELLVRLATISSEQEVETESLLAESRGHLAVVNESLACSGSISQAISKSGAKMADGVGQVIVALQSQDMARQKIQHVNAAIDDMVLHIDACQSPAAPDEDEYRHFLFSASLVQLAQLKKVFGQLDEAASQVAGGLSKVESEARLFTQHAMKAGSAILDGRIIGRAARSIRSVLAVIEKSVASIADTTDVVERLKSMFSDTTTQTVELARSLRLVSLNAQIFATQVEAGTALEAVAKNTRGVAGEAMRQLHDISSRISGLVSAVVELEQRLKDYRELANLERTVLAQEADESEQKLQALEQQLQNSGGQIITLEEELSETVRRTAERMRFPLAVAESSARSTTLFERIAAEFKDASECPSAEMHLKVKELKRHYTMENERDVHESSLVRTAVAAKRAFFRDANHDVPGTQEVNDELLPDNVELF